ncbi:hypothetical protein ACFFNY_07580 [Paenibacillus hodogayensis]|uniref:DUF4015 domain-containing protein n=1 Tax=Paenibacillus hodogayensis TaxID=279208 RepID=A0ABV5VT03_9BACL
MSGIHLHPHDMLDEGPAAILELIGTMGPVRYLLPELNTIFERNPYPAGVLPHNPKRGVVQGTGTFHVPLDTKELFPGLYQTVDPSVENGQDPLGLLLEATRETEYEVVPWVNLLNGRFEGNMADNGVVDFRGRTIEHWLCPNGRDVVELWTNVLAAVSDKYGCTTFLLDRLRFPDWAGERVDPSGLFTCFCERCRSGLAARGLEADAVREEMEQVAGLLRDKSYDQAVSLLLGSQTLQAWVGFKQDSVSAFIEKLVASLRRRNPAIVCWLDLWPPSYSWILGQDYTRLTKQSPALKHFPYHKLGGGADVQGLIDSFASEPEESERAFRAFQRLFAMDYPITYESFRRDGFPIEFVGIENDKVRALSQPGTHIFSGVQMWNLTPQELSLALGKARESAADDVLFYCYGWAGRELFEAVGSFPEERSAAQKQP